MAAAVACTPTTPVSTVSACRVDVTGADENTLTGYSASIYPSSPQVAYYLKFTKGGTEYGRSYVFAPAADGTHTFNNYVFPSAGSWTITLAYVSDDSSAATASVTVS